MLPRRKEGFTFEIGNNQYNYYHNRYKDVLPYDQTRIVLKTNSENDYINASYIDVRNQFSLKAKAHFLLL
jgi:tyrosine-protein phosphatase non-receptor type 4